MVSVAALQADHRKLTINLPLGTSDDGESNVEHLTVSYRPSVITPKFDRKIKDIFGGKDSERGGSAWVSEVLTSWDLTDESGNIVSLEVESVMTLPSWFITKIIMEVNKDMGGVEAPSVDS